MQDGLYGSEVRRAGKKTKKKTLGYKLCFCQLRDAAKGSREQCEEGGREGGKGGVGG